MKKVAIVILNWNGEEMLHRYLPSVITYSREEADVYVADNASTDNSLQLLKHEFPEVKTIVLEKNWGFAEGYNKALAHIDANYYLLLNSDIEVTHHWLTPMIEYMDTHDDVAVCQPKLLSVFNHDMFEYAGASGGYIDYLGYPFCRGRLFDTVERDDGQYAYPADIFWATGAAFLVRARIYNKVGGLDPRFFAHNEEIDLCWRIRLAGYRIVCLPDSTVYHVGGGTLPKSNPMKTYLNFRNNLTMLYKCLPDSELQRVMRLRCLLDHIAALKMLVADRQWGEFKAVIRARRHFRRWRHDFDDDRRRIQASRVVSSIPEQRRYSLLWQYYVKGRKMFSQLP